MLEMLLQPGDEQERCGLVFEDGSTVEIKNIANNPVTSYEMDPQEALPHLTEGKVTGTWHTHPDASPQLSGEDYKGFLGWPKLQHHIIGVVDGKTEVKTYKVENGLVIECD